MKLARRIITASLLAIQLFVLSTQESVVKDPCVYGQPCWPSKETFQQLEADNPTLKVIQRGDDGWDVAGNLVLNERIIKVPGAVIYVSSVEDIITVLNFTKTYDMDLKLISTGHEFIGRNTAEGCLQVSVARMVNTSVDLNCPENAAGCLTAEPGVWWLQAYRVADSVGRTILGGAEPSVSVTGWSLGGGHSPFSPKIGLGADQIVELSMVLADLSHVALNKDGITQQHSNGTVTSSNDTDLFWAVRGGGGGTFGVVTSIKFRLHMPPSKFTTMTCAFAAVESPKQGMQEIKRGMREVMVDLPEEFGGYVFSGTLCYAYIPQCLMAVYATYAFTHYGARSDNAAAFDKLDAKADELFDYLLSGPCTTTEYDSFYEYVSILPNTTYEYVKIDGTFISPTEYSEEFIDDEADLFAKAFNSKKLFFGTWIRLGGQTRNDSSGATAINPLFRSAMWTVAYGGDEDVVKDFGELVGDTVKTRGQYYSECSDDLSANEWQKQFWGKETYSELQDVKKKYDEHNFFTCVQCVENTGSHLMASVAVSLLLSLLQQIFLAC